MIQKAIQHLEAAGVRSPVDLVEAPGKLVEVMTEIGRTGQPGELLAAAGHLGGVLPLMVMGGGEERVMARAWTGVWPVGLAMAEEMSGGRLGDVAARVVDGKVAGSKTGVVGEHLQAWVWLVREGEGMSLVLVERGVKVTPGARVADVRLCTVSAEEAEALARVGEAGGAEALLEKGAPWYGLAFAFLPVLAGRVLGEAEAVLRKSGQWAKAWEEFAAVRVQVHGAALSFLEAGRSGEGAQALAARWLGAQVLETALGLARKALRRADWPLAPLMGPVGEALTFSVFTGVRAMLLQSVERTPEALLPGLGGGPTL